MQFDLPDWRLAVRYLGVVNAFYPYMNWRFLRAPTHSKNCGCEKQLDQMEAYARAQQQDAPDVQKFLAGIASIRAEGQPK